MAIRQRDIVANHCAMLALVVGQELSSTTSPAAFNTQHRLTLSPTSIPIVRPTDLRTLLLRAGFFSSFLIFFFMPVSFFAPRVRFRLGQLNAKPVGRPAFSSHLGNVRGGFRFPQSNWPFTRNF